MGKIIEFPSGYTPPQSDTKASGDDEAGKSAEVPKRNISPELQKAKDAMNDNLAQMLGVPKDVFLFLTKMKYATKVSQELIEEFAKKEYGNLDREGVISRVVFLHGQDGGNQEYIKRNELRYLALLERLYQLMASK